MGALPKRRTSKARQGKRRSHLRMIFPNLDSCPQCHSPKLPHRVCTTCGVYAGRDVMKIKQSTKRG